MHRVLVRDVAGARPPGGPGGLDYDIDIDRDKFAGGGTPGRGFRPAGGGWRVWPRAC